MKRFAAMVLVSLMLVGSALAKDIKMADYPLAIKALSMEDDSHVAVAPMFVPSTGYSVNTYSRVGGTRMDIQINGVIYITEILAGCRHCQDIVLGQVYQARMYPWRRWNVIEYLQTPTKGTEMKIVKLRVIGQRLAHN
jgi:hypothetical protein